MLFCCCCYWMRLYMIQSSLFLFSVLILFFISSSSRSYVSIILSSMQTNRPFQNIIIIIKRENSWYYRCYWIAISSCIGYWISNHKKWKTNPKLFSSAFLFCRKHTQKIEKKESKFSWREYSLYERDEKKRKINGSCFPIEKSIRRHYYHWHRCRSVVLLSLLLLFTRTLTRSSYRSFILIHKDI